MTLDLDNFIVHEYDRRCGLQTAEECCPGKTCFGQFYCTCPHIPGSGSVLVHRQEEVLSHRRRAAPRPCCLLLPRAESASRNAIRRPSKASHSPCVTACIYATIWPVPGEQRLLAASRMCAMCTREVTNWLENVEESARHPHPQQRALNGSKERRETLRSA